jgi:hypothetical protein
VPEDLQHEEARYESRGQLRAVRNARSSRRSPSTARRWRACSDSMEESFQDFQSDDGPDDPDEAL